MKLQQISAAPITSSEARNESSTKKVCHFMQLALLFFFLLMFKIQIVPQSPPDLVVFGSLAVDLACDHSPVDLTNNTDAGPIMKTSNPSVINQTIGGVGRNVALAAHIASGALNVRLCSVVGADSYESS
jgi:hypothetical protein